MTRNLDLCLVRAFIAIAETGSISKAAESMFRSQSTVSLQLKKLEDVLGVILFDRTVNGLVLTRNGKSFMRDARDLLRTNDRILASVTGLSAVASVRVGITEEIGADRLAPILSLYHQRFPQVMVNVRVRGSRSLKAGLRSGRLDLVVVKVDPRFEAETILAEDRLTWVIGEGHRRLLDRRPLPVVGSSPASIHGRHITEALEHAGLPYAVTCTSDTYQAVVAAVVGGLGVGAIDESALIPGIQRVEPGMLPALPATYLSLIQSDRRGLDEIYQLADIIQSQFGPERRRVAAIERQLA